jgi:hypothetical protein
MIFVAFYENDRVKYADDTYAFLDSNNNLYGFRTKIKIYPESYVTLIGKYGIKNYDLSREGHPLANVGSAHYELGVGLEGSIATTIEIGFLVTFTYKDYAKWLDYHEPVFDIHIIERFSTQTSFKAGYKRSVEDSSYSFSNYSRNQQLYFEFKSIYADQYIIIAETGYTNQSYSKGPLTIDILDFDRMLARSTNGAYVNRAEYIKFGARTDRKLYGAAKLEVPLGKTFSVLMNLAIDYVISDAYDLDVSEYLGVINPDRPISYKVISTYLGIKAKI